MRNESARSRGCPQKCGASPNDVNIWLKRFAKELRVAPDGNPIEKLLKLDSESNPYFLTFLIYWYRTPARRLAEKSRDHALAATRRMKLLSARLREIATDLRPVVHLRVPPQFGMQTGELIKGSLSATDQTSPGEQLSKLAADCEAGANLVERIYKTVSDQACGKRNPRNVYEVLFYCHLLGKMGSTAISPIGLALLDCADEAFDSRRQKVQQWASIELSAKRFRERTPRAYERLATLARQNRRMFSAEEIIVWSRLSDDDCAAIIADLRPRFDRELELFDAKPKTGVTSVHPLHERQ